MSFQRVSTVVSPVGTTPPNACVMLADDGGGEPAAPPKPKGRAASAAAGLMAYFAASILLTVFNKWFFSNKRLGVRFPLTVTCLHQGIVFCMVLATEKRWLAPVAGEITRRQELLLPLAAVGVVCGVDWGLSNTSLRFIPLSLYEMTKSASPLFVLLITVAAGMSPLTPALTAIITCISVGMFLAVSGGDLSVFRSAEFPFGGFVCVAVATVLSGVRVVMAQFAMQRLRVAGHATGVNAVTALYYSAPASCAALVIPAFIVEGTYVRLYLAQQPLPIVLETLTCVLFSAGLAFLLSLTELVATRSTSALTLCVVGVIKQLLLILAAMTVFSERVGSVNLVGFGVAMVGVAIYNYSKYAAAAIAATAAAAAAAAAPNVVPAHERAGSRGSPMPASPHERSDSALFFDDEMMPLASGDGDAARRRDD
jgi:solute carrier family 35 protein C2